jgi:ankyrin repeat protein
MKILRYMALAGLIGSVQGIVSMTQYRNNVNRHDKHGKTALHYAAAQGDEDEVFALLDAGADINARDNEGNTPLHEAAAFQNNYLFIKTLITSGAQVNAENSKGETPLDKAKYFGNIRSAEAITKLGGYSKKF